jgi:alpha-beta hydrolase superfamily lysophospholipase
VLSVLVACGGDDGDGAAAPAGSTTTIAASTTSASAAAVASTAQRAGTAESSTTAADRTATTVAVAPPTAPTVLTMGQTTLALEDPSRPTNFVERVVDASPTRRLPTLVSYPAATAGRDVPLVGGPYPLIVLSHGLTASAAEFDHVYPALVSAGYVVAAPDFPETTGGQDFRALGNVVHQPDDVRFVIDQLLAANDDVASPLHGAIDADRIGVGGHSLGAITTLLYAYNTRFGDERVDAVYESAGSMFPVDGGAYDFVDAPPLLVVHGDPDPVVPYQGGVDVYAAAQAPKWFLTIAGAGHGGYLRAGDPTLQPHNDAVVAFFDRYLKDDPTGEQRLAGTEIPGLTTLQSEP